MVWCGSFATAPYHLRSVIPRCRRLWQSQTYATTQVALPCFAEQCGLEGRRTSKCLHISAAVRILVEREKARCAASLRTMKRNARWLRRPAGCGAHQLAQPIDRRQLTGIGFVVPVLPAVTRRQITGQRAARQLWRIRSEPTRSGAFPGGAVRHR